MRVRLAILVALVLSATLCPAQLDPDWVRSKLEQLRLAPQPVKVQPKEGTRDFNVTGDTRAVYTAIGNAFGVTFVLDEGTTQKRVDFRVPGADYATAVEWAGQMTRTFTVALLPDRVLVANDTPAKRRELERYVLRAFYFPDLTSPQELNDMVNLLRTVFEIRNIVPQPATNSIEVRAPLATIEAVERFIPSLSPRKPEVMLDVRVFEVNRSLLRNIGVDLPLQFQIFNIGSAALAALNSPNLQNLINQLITSGGLNGANAGSLAALVGQLQNQQNSLLANPVATFGGGLTLFGIGVPPATVHFERNESRVNTLEHTSLRATEGVAANLHVGTRYPILTQSFTSGVQIGNTNQTVGSIGGVIPGFQYEDLGVTIKATPAVRGTQAVTLNMELAIRSLGAQQFNNIPVIQNREYKGVITVPNGESAVLAGTISRNESQTVRGMPGFGRVPILGRAVSTEGIQNDETELLVLVTPQIIAARETSSQVIVMPKTAQ